MFDLEYNTVDLESLKVITSKIAQNIKNMDEIIISLEGYWEGAASDSFYLRMKDDLQYLIDYYNFLLKFISTWNEAQTGYQDAEKTIFDEAVSIYMYW